MELRQLEYFVAVAEEANFTRAAAKLHVSQPGVSAQIRSLERELGQELLDRSARVVRLTDVGAAVLDYARAALSAAEGARLVVDELTGLLRGHVAIGTVTSHSADLPGLLARFHAAHPAVEITLSEDRSDQLCAALRSGRLDVAIISLGSHRPEGVETHIVTDETVVAAVSPDHDLSNRSTVPLEALRGQRLISLPRGTGLRRRLDEACAAAGFSPHITLEASSPGILADLAAHGLGVAILPESAAHPPLHAARIVRPRVRGQLALAWREEGPISPAARTLIRSAREEL